MIEERVRMPYLFWCNYNDTKDAIDSIPDYDNAFENKQRLYGWLIANLEAEFQHFFYYYSDRVF